ncbi:carbohydrate-selective porin OprB [Calothrix sp. NIES-2100]|uniref:iron uptake porin n=1 Tax=Calothrix sp. NIES-2100 TaxID=1954172 RepID=UPI000B607B99|nr:carbohydrate-selective porin OprB [Calothrix sp. NIES-2100]
MRNLKFLGNHRSVYRQILLAISAILVYQILPTSIQVFAQEVKTDGEQSVTEQKTSDGQGIDQLLFFPSLPTTVNSSKTPFQEQNHQTIIAQTSRELNSPPSADSSLFETSNEDESENDPMAQVTNISQLQDVQPTDWAFQAIQSLVERYGCIAGYPNGTFRGDRALSRYEFAAGLNACLDRVNELIGSATQELVTKKDLETLKRLQEEFAAELATLRGRVDALEARTTELEANQFSTTTKLFANLRVQTNAYFSGDGDPKANIQYNLFLGFLSSFTGRDLLLTAIGVTNTQFPDLASTNNGRDVGSTREGSSDATGSGDTGNFARLIGLEYQFPVGDKLLIDIVAANRYRFSPFLLSQYVPYYRLGQGPTSAFAEAPPIYLVGAGSGVSASYKIVDSTVLTLTYLGTFADQSQAGGWFNGDYVAAAQVHYNPNPNLFLQLLYQHGYFSPGNFGFNNGQTFRGNGFVGSALANRFDDAGVLFNEASAVTTNAYQVGGYVAIAPKVLVGGWANLIKARLIGKGDADIWTYSVQAAFPDLFRKGNQGGLIVGMEPTLTGLRTNLPHPEFKNDTSLHIEAYYRHQLSEQVSISPSLIWITSPNQDNSNEDIIIGGVRTNFNF